MISAWTRHIKNEDEKEKFKNEILRSKDVLQRLQDVLKEMESDQDSIERNTKIYDLPNWDYRQAHLNGFKDCLNKINKILTLDQQDK